MKSPYLTTSSYLVMCENDPYPQIFMLLLRRCLKYSQEQNYIVRVVHWAFLPNSYSAVLPYPPARVHHLCQIPQSYLVSTRLLPSTKQCNDNSAVPSVPELPYGVWQEGKETPLLSKGDSTPLEWFQSGVDSLTLSQRGSTLLFCFVSCFFPRGCLLLLSDFWHSCYRTS